MDAAKIAVAKARGSRADAGRVYELLFHLIMDGSRWSNQIEAIQSMKVLHYMRCLAQPAPQTHMIFCPTLSALSQFY